MRYNPARPTQHLLALGLFLGLFVGLLAIAGPPGLGQLFMTGPGLKWPGLPPELELAGSASVGGNLNVAGSKNFRIDHPMDPANRYLIHFASEGPEPFNVYAGRVIADDQGMAQVELPAWFEAINTDFRYQLTALAGPAPDLHVAREVVDNAFVIGGARPGGEVSWELRARRDDRTMRRLEPVPEMDKPAHLRGTYVDPLAWELPEP